MFAQFVNKGRIRLTSNMDLIVKAILVVFVGLLALATGIPIPKDVVALPIEPAFILPPIQIRPPVHDSASIESNININTVDGIKWPEISKNKKRTGPSKIKK